MLFPLDTVLPPYYETMDRLTVKNITTIYCNDGQTDNQGCYDHTM